jgi:CSLREA domain-containing protein
MPLHPPGRVSSKPSEGRTLRWLSRYLLALAAYLLTLFVTTTTASAWLAEIVASTGGGGNAYAVAIDNAGDVFAAGYLLTSTSLDFAVVKLDNANGSEIWRRTIDGPGSGQDRAYTIALHPSGDPIVAGFLCASECSGADATVARFDAATGDTVWLRQVERLPPDSARNATESASSPLSTIYARLAIGPQGDVVASSAWGPSVAKLNGETGADIWFSGIQAPNFVGAPAVALDRNGDVAAAGSNLASYTVAKFAGDTGDELWRFVFDDYSAYAAGSVVFDPVGEVIASGATTLVRLNGQTGASIQVASIAPAEIRALALDVNAEIVLAGSFPASDSQDVFYVAKRDATGGSEIWANTLSSTVGHAEAVAVDADNNVLVAGRLEAEQYDFAVVKLNGVTGDEIWRLLLEGTANGSADRANALALDDTGNIVAAGVLTNRSPSSDFGSDLFSVVKLNGADGSIFRPLAEAQPIPPELDFGNVPLGQSDSRTLELLSAGTADLTVTGAEFRPSGGGEFSLSTASSFPVTLARADVLQLVAEFAPINKGQVSRTLVISTEGTDHPVVEVPIQAIGGAQCDDTLDNDGDRLIDFPEDPQCISPSFPTESPDFIVDSTRDAVDADPGDGACSDASGECTLRAAIQETNALTGSQIVGIPAGHYVLTIPGAGEHASATGDLDITDDLGLVGAGSEITVIDADGIDRVFDIWWLYGPCCRTRPLIQLSAITVTGGQGHEGTYSYGGTGIRVGESSLTVSDSEIRGNGTAPDSYRCFALLGGGYSTMELIRSRVTQNACGGVRASLGSVLFQDSEVSYNDGIGLSAWPFVLPVRIHSSTIRGNGDGGAYFADAVEATIVDSTIDGNYTDSPGRAGGVTVGLDARASISGTAITNNVNSAGGAELLWSKIGARN